MPKELNSLLSDFTSGYKRKIVQLKEEGTMQILEGKTPITFEGYKFLAKTALQTLASKDCKLAQCFLVFCWNLVARSTTVGAINIHHISWNGDALVVQYGRTKIDQAGDNCTPHHIYANPSNPSICPILSLALYVFTKGSKLEKCTFLRC
ncbi:hypothetical protein AeRB84_020675 [Aphanomyces euteiches]|nr:hypothetical protein AeRB84_020675 [Aphanomyces euteiches]